MTVPPSQETKHPDQAPLTPEQLQKQLDSGHRQVYDSLRTHFEEARKREEARQREATSARGGVAWFRRNRTDLYFLITLLALGWIWSKVGGGTTDTENTPPDSSVVAIAPVTPTSSHLSGAFARPDSGLTGYLLNNPARAAAWLTATAAAVKLDTAHIGDAVKLGTLAETVARKGEVSDTADLTLVRNAAFNYVYGLWERRHEDAAARHFSVNPEHSTFDGARLKEIVNRLDLVDVVGNSVVGTDKGFRTAVVVRWMQSYASNDTTSSF